MMRICLVWMLTLNLGFSFNSYGNDGKGNVVQSSEKFEGAKGHILFRSEPNTKYSSASPSPVTPELKSMARGGFITVKGWNLGFMRWLFSVSASNPDTTGLKVRKENIGKDVAIIVEPDVRKSDGAIFFVHGGGLVVGSNEEVYTDAYNWARELGVIVVLPSYSLAPEHPFPAAQNDLHSTWHWLQKNSSNLKINPNKVIVGGASAGGGLAAALVQRLHDEKGVQPVAQLLIYPMLNDGTAVRKDLKGVKHAVWNNNSNLFGWTSYLGKAPGAETVPKYSVPARRKDLAGLPPAWIGVGNADLFLDEDRIYAQRLRDAGVSTTYLEVDGGIHSLDSSSGELAAAFRREHTKFASKFLK